MGTEQVTTITICQFEGIKNRFFALKSMAFLIPEIVNSKGLKFVKLMGSGGGNGFAIYPNWGQYALLAVWENEDEKIKFYSENEAIKRYMNHAQVSTTYVLKNIISHGIWGGINPFVAQKVEGEPTSIAVITRATIKWWDMIRFWKKVPSSSKNMDGFPGCELAIGIGELPFRYQATFSIWSDEKSMRNFAYNSKQHTDMITQTRKVGWYKEELFARFRVVNKHVH